MIKTLSINFYRKPAIASTVVWSEPAGSITSSLMPQRYRPPHQRRRQRRHRSARRPRSLQLTMISASDKHLIRPSGAAVQPLRQLTVPTSIRIAQALRQDRAELAVPMSEPQPTSTLRSQRRDRLLCHRCHKTALLSSVLAREVHVNAIEHFAPVARTLKQPPRQQHSVVNQLERFSRVQRIIHALESKRSPQRSRRTQPSARHTPTNREMSRSNPSNRHPKLP